MGFWIKVAAAAALLLSSAVTAHDHHSDKIEEGHAVSADPIDSTLWVHILIQSMAWGIIFPTGMVLGIIRSKWHVPVQTLGSLLAVVGYFLGHKHKGRQFTKNIHARFVPYIMLMLIAQIAMGIYLKLHLEKGIHGKIRKIVLKGHGFVGKAMPIVTWVQFVFGGITALGFCRADHTGQCLAHFIMGSAFIAYGIILIILLLVGQVWLRRTGRSQEFFDSLVIAAWGCVNTFTEHRWGHEWAHNDLQHTSMGIVWWAAGLVGVWLSRTRDGRPKRNLIPGMVIFVTGWAMSSHPQHLPISTMIHTVFGYTLMAAGAARVIEIAFVLKDRSAMTPDGSDPNSFQYMTPFLLIAGGFLFMGATEEQMQILHDASVTHVSYVLILFSVAFLMFLFVNMLVHLYAVHAWGQASQSDSEAPRINGVTNGHANGRIRRDRRLRDAEEFELAGLDSDDESDAPLHDKETKPLVAHH
ncbi:hypothetical protein BDU57DRAFT_596003 [Ampelomyces quisqualis]|uniref:Integral membrane protein-like protein n=1 Tax=Ampelomyces quisqualis TaxID=50730 RepID=A0A6A5QJA8_AMPQU|nr:hypothetical protein BDU57DRAFT_596003 [Ampelomyces quisqualis]